MSQYKKLENLERTLMRELEILNDEIDRKIIRGISYSRESKRHKFILNNLNQIRKINRVSWLSKSFSNFSII